MSSCSCPFRSIYYCTPLFPEELTLSVELRTHRHGACQTNARQSIRAGTGKARTRKCRARVHRGHAQAQHTRSQAAVLCQDKQAGKRGNSVCRWQAGLKPLDQKILEKVPEPRGVCFKFWVIKSRSCFRHSPRSHIRGCLWNSEPDSHANSHNAFGQLFWFSGKYGFGQKMPFCDIQNIPRKDSLFGVMAQRLVKKIECSDLRVLGGDIYGPLPN